LGLPIASALPHGGHLPVRLPDQIVTDAQQWQTTTVEPTEGMLRGANTDA